MISLKKHALLCCLLFSFSCYSPNSLRKKSPHAPVKALDTSLALTTIAFGSCNHQYEAQPMWQHILKNKPDLWIWLGDNIYADTENMKSMRQKYMEQINHPDYQALLQACPIIGTWDDHDYGVNNGGKEYPQKEMSKVLFENFMGLSNDDPVRNRPGIYNSYTIGEPPRQVKIILLDCRSFRDTPPAVDAAASVVKQSDILGTAQWRWLEEELANSKANLHLIAGGIQFLPEDHRFERWDEFPMARQKLLEMVRRYRPSNLVFLSGDRHIGEISQMQLDSGPLLTEITSSGLTHSYEEAGDEPNRHRIGKIVNQQNFGLINIDWTAETPSISAQIRGLDNKIFEEINLDLK